MGIGLRDTTGADGDRPASWLLDLTAVIDSRTNASTACCDTHDIQRVLKIQITFVVADPPQVSYFCAYCTGSIFTEKPRIIHTEGNLALLHIGVGRWNCAFYVYHANGGSNGEPSLTVLPQPSGIQLERNQIGLLPGGAQDGYHVAALSNASEPPLQFELYLYSSKTQTWTVKKPVLVLNELQRQQAGEFRPMTSEVITVGGDSGTMGFVDRSRGILFCNVLQGDCPHLHYVPLPTRLHHNHGRIDGRDGWRVCHISVDTKAGRIRFVEVYPHHGWQAVTWSTSATAASSNQEEGWRQDRNLFASQLLLPAGDLPEQLPREPCWDGRGGPPPPATQDLKKMYAELPTLSLHDGDTLYHTISDDFVAWDWWVVAVDMANMTVQDVAHYRRSKARLRFQQSYISSYLDMGASPAVRAAGSTRMLELSTEALHSMKRLGLEALQPSMMDNMASSWVGEQEQHQDAGTINGAHYGDDMDWT